MNNELTTIASAPVALVTKEQAELAVKRIKVMVADASKMTIEQLTTIAQESLLYRTMPGRDIHYFLNGSKLERVPDYKYLISFIQNRERLATSDPGLKIVFEDKILTDEEKLTEGAATDDYVVRVTVSTNRDRDAYRQEVANWIKLGLNVSQAMEAARRMMGDNAGTSAVGVVKKTDGNIPKGWTPIQKAKKLAIKAAIRLRWGEPSVDEMMSYVRQMARIETTEEDWLNTPLDLPAEAQARYAELQAAERERQEQDAGMTPEDHAERLSGNPLNRSDNGDPTANPEQDFCDRITQQIPYFQHGQHVKNTLKKLGLPYSPESEGELTEALNSYAGHKADDAASQLTIDAAAAKQDELPF